MSKELLSPPLLVKPEGPVNTPYFRAKEEWDNRIGKAVVQAKNWRLAFFASAALSLILAVGLIQQALQMKVVPMVIAVDEDSGKPFVVGKPKERQYEPRLEEVRYFLSEFIKKVRSVPADPVLIKSSWLDAYLFLRQEAANTLNAMTEGDPENPLNHIGEKTVSVRPLSVVQVGEGNSYQARWKEKLYDRSGSPIEEYTMTGVFTIEFETPSTERVLQVNPLGIFIKHFQWSREL